MRPVNGIPCRFQPVIRKKPSILLYAIEMKRMKQLYDIPEGIDN